MDEPARIECPCCGHALAVPPEVRENAHFACAHCSLMLRNAPGARAFRWEHVDPYVRRHGVSRANLWGGLLGSLAWLPALALAMALSGRFDVGALLLLAGPYLVLLAVMRKRRARTPAVAWSMELWAGLGAYILLLYAFHLVLPARMAVVFAEGGGSFGPPAALALGATWLLMGLGGRAWYRRRAARLPQASGTPPTA